MEYTKAPKYKARYSYNSLSGLTPATILSLLTQADAGYLGPLNAAAQDLLSKADLKGLVESRVSALNRKTLALKKHNEVDPGKEIIFNFCKYVLDNLRGINADCSEYSRNELITKMSLSWFYGLSVNFIEWCEDSVYQYPIPKYVHHIDERTYKTDIHKDGAILIDACEVSGKTIKELDPLDINYLILKDSLSSRMELGGIARSLLPVWYLRNRSSLNLMAYAEKFSIPSVMITSVPGSVEPLSSNNNTSERSSLEEFIQSYMNDCAAILPPGYQAEIFGAVSGGEKIFETVDRITKSQLATAILGQDGTSSGSGGSLAKAQINELTRQDLIDSDCKRVASAFQSILEKAVRIQFGSGYESLIPEVYFEESLEVQREIAIEELKAAKSMGLPISKRYAYELLKIPAPLDQNDIL